LSSQIIKDYNFIGKESIPTVSRDSIMAAGNYEEPELPRFLDVLPNSRRTHVSRSNKVITDAEVTSHKGKISHNNLHQSEIVISAVPEKSPVEKLKEEYELRLKKENQDAYLRGLAEGRKQGVAEWTPQSQRISNALEKAMSALSQRNESNLQAMEKSIGDLAMFLAQKIVGEAVSRVPEVIKENIDKCLKLLAGSGNVAIKINPADYDIVKAYLPSLLTRHEGKFTFLIEPAQNISPGGCFLELDGSLVDGRIETQLENIRQHIQLLS
jgi:flagellar biosynthesis/type III secretory pathway protein FliH